MERKLADDYVQYPHPEEDGIDEFCRKCHPAARRMFTNLTTARDNGSRDLTEIGERVRRLVDPTPRATSTTRMSRPQKR